MANEILPPYFFEGYKDDSGSNISRHILILKEYNADYVKMPSEYADNILNYYLNSMSNQIIYQRAYEFFRTPNKVSTWLLASRNFYILLNKLSIITGGNSLGDAITLTTDSIVTNIDLITKQKQARKIFIFTMLLTIKAIYPEYYRVRVNLAPEMWDLEYLIGNKFDFDVTLARGGNKIIVYEINPYHQQLKSHNEFIEDLYSPANNLPIFEYRDDFLLLVEEIISNHISCEKFGINDAADQLNITPRTLQRRLAKLGTSFIKIRDAERRKILEKKFSEGLSIYEISDMVGFSDVSSVYKLLKKKVL